MDGREPASYDTSTESDEVLTRNLGSSKMKNHWFRFLSGTRSCVAPLTVLLLLLFATERPAKAYIDPGSGALVWQGMLATLLGAAFYFGRAIRWAKNKVAKARQVPPPYVPAPVSIHPVAR